MRKFLTIQTFLVISIAIALLLRFYLGVFRYFDPDEFAHFHWAYHFVLGMKPYKDFFIYHIPFFQFFLLPAFLLPQGPLAVIMVRVLMFTIFAISMGCIFGISYKVTKSRVISLLAVFIMAIFPIMTDKSIEIRPDMLMVMLYLVPLLLLLYKKTNTSKRALLMGFILGCSIMVYQKILFAIPAFALMFVWDPLLRVLKRTASISETITHLAHVSIPWIIGGSIPPLLFLGYLVVTGIFSDALFFIIDGTKLVYSVESVKFSPLLALTPWPLIYLDRGGPSLPWAVNIVLLLSILGGIICLALQRRWKFFWYYVVFGVSSFIYLLAFPTPFVQYYIPIATVGATLSAIFFATIIRIVKHPKLTVVLYLMLMGIGLVSYFQQYQVRVTAINTNVEQMQVVDDVVSHSKPNESFYDMVGSYVFRPPGFNVCCFHYAEWAKTLEKDKKILSLRQSLIKNQTKFLLLDRNGYVFWLVPEPDMTFLKTNYLPSAYHKIYTVGYHFSCVLGTCTRLELDSKPVAAPENMLPIFIAETYKISLEPETTSITINGKQLNHGDTIALEPGEIQFLVSESVSKVTVQLDR